MWVLAILRAVKSLGQNDLPTKDNFLRRGAAARTASAVGMTEVLASSPNREWRKSTVVTGTRTFSCVAGWVILATCSTAAFGVQAAFDTSWLTSSTIPAERVTSSLNAIAGMSAEDAKETVAAYEQDCEAYSPDGQHVSDLLAAVALEQSGDQKAAEEAHKRLANRAKGTPYAVTAAYRLRVMGTGDIDQDAKEKLYEEMAKEPTEDGWFVISGRWAEDDTRRAALHALIELNEDRLSFRFLQALRFLSPFPPAYAYLGVLLLLTIGARLIALPLLLRNAKMVRKLRVLAPEIQAIRQTHSGDTAAMNEKLLSLYGQHDIRPVQGCAIAIVDLVFVIWALVVMSDFVPQMALDGAKFIWVTDLSAFDIGVVLLWIGISGVVPLLTGAAGAGTSAGSVLFNNIVTGLIFLLIAWYWEWPAYLFIFWGLLTLVGVLLSRVVIAISSATED